MTTYALGDIQGCFSELTELLNRVDFKPGKDRLWVAGDVVNRGPDSKSALEFLYEHRDSVTLVLGNHDLHLLAIYYGIRSPRQSDTVNPILASKNADKWMHWLRQCPLFHHDKSLGYSMVHAGVPPQWSIRQTLSYASEVETELKSRRIEEFLQAMYGNEPALWDSKLKHYERLRCITNYLTRMRLVSQQGALNFDYTGDIQNIPDGFYPWFNHPKRKAAFDKIIFGHWAALGGHINAFCFGLDTGCVWGRFLTMMDLETQELHVACSSES